jgi:hypothetical protein
VSSQYKEERACLGYNERKFNIAPGQGRITANIACADVAR